VAKQALGRGLKALLPDTPRARVGLVELPVDHLEPNPRQPRHSFSEADLAELAASIAQYGVLQPVLVSETTDGRYRLVAGERRWRAARMAGLATVPAIIRERLDDDRLGLSQAEIADRVGIDRSTVANALRLLKLPADLQAMVEDGSLTGGHARALLAFASDDERRSWAERAVEAGLSVRDLERAAARGRSTQAGGRRRRPAQDPNLQVAEERLSLHLGAKVEIRSRRRGGQIVISCPDQAELMRVFDRLMEGS
jgi:ParB family chromosome partitioning protein